MSVDILVVDDDSQSLHSTKRILEHEGYQVRCASSGREALEFIKVKKPSLIVTDVRMPEMSGMEFVEAFQKAGFTIPFVVMTAFGQVQDAVWAMKMGAVDFLLKPFKRQALLDAVALVLSRAKPAPTEVGPSFIGTSAVMKRLNEAISQVAKTSAPVLILGESGSGKEYVSRLIHAQAHAGSKAPFIAVNCAAIPENLLESELFGYEKGAFSGAGQTKIGLIEAANGGTLLLDEIGDMPLSLQPKLLRVLEEQKLRRLGANADRQIQVRFLAATHQNLAKWVQEGKFRQDLYYRLDVMRLQVPALRERSEDIPALATHLLRKFSVQHQKVIDGFDSTVEDRLSRHSWPGNVRELANVVERAVVLCQGTRIGIQDLPLHLQDATQFSSAEQPHSLTIPLGMSLKEVEDLMIQKALMATQGDRAETAKLLGVNERTIYRRMSKVKEE